MKRHWYVYHLLDPATQEVVYIGKGAKSRLSCSLRNRSRQYGKLVGEKIVSFWNEEDAYSHEKELIEQLKPLLNKAKGGGGGLSGRIKVTAKTIEKETKLFYSECERYGTRWMACKVLMNYLGYFPLERAQAISKQYYDGLKTTKVYKHA